MTHPRLEAVGFTGSRSAGLALTAIAHARARPIPVYAEMSSINPVFILPGAMRERGAQIAAGLAQSVTLGVGQFCTNPGLVVGLEDSGDLTSFAALLSANVAASVPSTMLNGGIYAAFGEGVARTSAIPGVTVVQAAPTTRDPAKHEAIPVVFETTASTFLSTPALSEEVFGPETLVIVSESVPDMLSVAEKMEGQLTATVHGNADDIRLFGALITILERRVGRLLFNGYPTGVEVSPAMQHGGPFPSTTDSRSTSVGTAAIGRFVRPICFQDAPASILPVELQDGNPQGILRLVDGVYGRE